MDSGSEKPFSTGITLCMYPDCFCPFRLFMHDGPGDGLGLAGTVDLQNEPTKHNAMKAI